MVVVDVLVVDVVDVVVDVDVVVVLVDVVGAIVVVESAQPRRLTPTTTREISLALIPSPYAPQKSTPLVILVSFNLLLPKKMTPESRGSLGVVAHVAQWIERLPQEQKVVGPIPTVGAQEMAIHNCDLVWRSSRKPQLIPTRSP